MSTPDQIWRYVLDTPIGQSMNIPYTDWENAIKFADHNTLFERNNKYFSSRGKQFEIIDVNDIKNSNLIGIYEIKRIK